ncbi:MAG TPA: septum formation initiator family protein [Nitrospirota bacterium]|jgi:cell division protein FtsB|nr:septum formation initiator family protein [Nitrospirota bacterium]
MRKRNYAKVDRSTKTGRMKKLLFAAMIPVGAYFLVTFVFGEMGLVKYYRMKAQYQALTQEIAELKQDNIRLMREVRALKTDPVYIEKLARDKLGLARNGEVVYYYDDANSKSQTPNPK